MEEPSHDHLNVLFKIFIKNTMWAAYPLMGRHLLREQIKTFGKDMDLYKLVGGWQNGRGNPDTYSYLAIQATHQAVYWQECVPPLVAPASRRGLHIWSDSTLALGGGPAGVNALGDTVATALRDFGIRSWNVEKRSALRDATYRMCVAIVKSLGGANTDCAEYYSLSPSERADRIDAYVAQKGKHRDFCVEDTFLLAWSANDLTKATWSGKEKLAIPNADQYYFTRGAIDDIPPPVIDWAIAVGRISVHFAGFAIIHGPRQRRQLGTPKDMGGQCSPSEASHGGEDRSLPRPR